MEITGQIIRYGLAGAPLAGLYAAVFWGLATQGGVPPQPANLVAFVINLAVGWLLHSRWSFRGYGLPHQLHIAQGRFIAINLLGYGLNSFWVWSVVNVMHRPVGQSLIPIVVVTPMVNFMLNRMLVFRNRL
jgi:putative flippase GtrA